MPFPNTRSSCCPISLSLSGPDTAELRLRIGVHSGSVTCGRLGGQFKIVGSTLEMASAMQATSQRHRIQVSHTTAELLEKAGRESWIRKRVEATAESDNTGRKDTYWVVLTNPLGRGGNASTYSQRSIASLRSTKSSKSSKSGSICGLDNVCDNTPTRPKRRQVWESEDNFIMALPPMSRAAKNKRMVGWVVKLFRSHLSKIISYRGDRRKSSAFEIDESVIFRVRKGFDNPMDERVSSIKQWQSQFSSDRSSVVSNEISEAEIGVVIARQLRDLVSKLSSLFEEANPYHNFETACQTTMSVSKLLNRCLALDNDDLDAMSCQASLSSARHYMTSISSSPLAQFTLAFAALVHDLGRKGTSNCANEESKSQQHSINLAWETLLDPSYKELHQCLFGSEEDLLMFRQLLVNCVLATDLHNEKAIEERTNRWDKAFNVGSSLHDEDMDMKATVVVECLVQASGISYYMQHWKNYTKWSERHFREKCMAYDNGSLFNPSETWYEEELAFFDTHVIPLAKRLSASAVFGVACKYRCNFPSAGLSPRFTLPLYIFFFQYS